MKSVLLLTVVLELFAGTFSSIDKLLGKRSSNSGRVGRNLDDFQTQVNQATYININDDSVCPTVPCQSVLDHEWCGALCEANDTAYGLLTNSIINCYLAGFCGKNFVNNTLTNVNISIAPGSYHGNCYLYGDRVTMTLTNQANQLTTYVPTATYTTNVSLQYVWEGLSLTCSTTTTNGGQNVAVPCCDNSLLNQGSCAVQQWVGALGFTLNLISCNCNCASNWGQPDTAFQSPVSVTQDESFTVYFIVLPAITTLMLTNNNIYTNVSLANAIPSQYVDGITSDITSVFTDYYTFYKLHENFYQLTTDVLSNFYSSCPTCGFS